MQFGGLNCGGEGFPIYSPQKPVQIPDCNGLPKSTKNQGTERPDGVRWKTAARICSKKDGTNPVWSVVGKQPERYGACRKQTFFAGPTKKNKLAYDSEVVSKIRFGRAR